MVPVHVLHYKFTFTFGLYLLWLTWDISCSSRLDTYNLLLKITHYPEVPTMAGKTHAERGRHKSKTRKGDGNKQHDSDIRSEESLKIKRMFNLIGVMFISMSLFVAITTTMFFTIPEVVEQLNFTEWKQRLFITYIFGCTVGNLILTRRTDTSFKTDNRKILANDHKSSSVPFRAHLCRLCGAVILKRDHHCFVLGKCIGYHNQKYFIWYNFHQTFVAFYCLLQNALYLSLAHGVEFPVPGRTLCCFQELWLDGYMAKQTLWF